MRGPIRCGIAACLLLAAPLSTSQEPIDPSELSPPPLPPRPKPKKDDPERPRHRSFLGGPEITPESDRPWGLSQELLERLAERARDYRRYADRFTCDETARLSQYDGWGEAGQEKIRRYAYTLAWHQGNTLDELRQRLDREGRPRPSRVEDEEPFPPAYGWVFLFGEFFQPYFAYRDLGERFDGFDWVREVQFRGALGFTDGKDIRQWEGTVLVNAETFTPLEIRAQPARQNERVLARYRRWARSFNLMGLRLGPKPLAYRSRILFGLRRDGLTFPTELRYDTLRAISPSRARRVRASIRAYDGYRFVRIDERERFEPE